MKPSPQRLFAVHEPTDHGVPPRELQTLGVAEDARKEVGVSLPAMAPFRDVPAGIWKVYLSAWAILFGLFLLFFTTNLAASFAVIIACLFAMMAFGLPAVLSALGKDEGRPRGAVIGTRTGPLSVVAAGVQIALIPVSAVIGLIAFIILAK